MGALFLGWSAFFIYVLLRSAGAAIPSLIMKA
jgi:hypothetical protein